MSTITYSDNTWARRSSSTWSWTVVLSELADVRWAAPTNASGARNITKVGATDRPTTAAPYIASAVRWIRERRTRPPSDATTGVAATAPAPTMVSMSPKPPGPRSNTSSAKTTASIWTGRPAEPINATVAKAATRPRRAPT